MEVSLLGRCFRKFGGKSLNCVGKFLEVGTVYGSIGAVLFSGMLQGGDGVSDVVGCVVASSLGCLILVA